MTYKETGYLAGAGWRPTAIAYAYGNKKILVFV